jgi:CBS domain containing-hemolysin-like protein
MSELAESLNIWFPGVLAMLLLIVCSGFFSASETAFFFLSREQIRGFSTGSGRHRMVASLLTNPDRLLSAVLFWNLLINLSYFAVGIVVVHNLTAQGFHTTAGIIGVLNLLGMIVLGEVIPKSVAAVSKSRLAPLVSWPIAVSVAVLDPLLPFLGRTSRVLRRAFWPHIALESPLHATDLEKAVDTSAALSEELLHIEQQVLHNILDLNEIAVEEVMRPRNHCVTVDYDQKLPELGVSVAKFDYLIVTDPDDGSFVGAVELSRIVADQDRTCGELAEPVIVVPWCASLAYVLGQLQNRFCGVAVVVHEHGETVGTVTYEDLLETMFSESPSRTRRVLRREPIIEIDVNRFHVEGLVTLRYLARKLRVALDDGEDTQYTLSGLFHDELERMPQVGDQISWNGWELRAIEVTPRGQVRALVVPEKLSVVRSSDGEAT